MTATSSQNESLPLVGGADNTYGGAEQSSAEGEESIIRERRKSTPEETSATLTLIKESNTVYNPKCIFHAEAWYVTVEEGTEDKM